MDQWRYQILRIHGSFVCDDTIATFHINRFVCEYGDFESMIDDYISSCTFSLARDQDNK